MASTEALRLKLIKQQLDPQERPAELVPSEWRTALVLFERDVGAIAAYALSSDAEASRAVLPHVLDMFHASLSQRLQQDEDPRVLLPETLRHLRHSCLWFIEQMGPRASDAVPDLLELLRRTLADADIVRPRVRLESALAKAGTGRLDMLLAALADPDPRMRTTMAFLMRYVVGFSEIVGPALVQRFDDPDDGVVVVAANSLLGLEPDWRPKEAAGRLRARMATIQNKADRADLERFLRWIEK